MVQKTTTTSTTTVTAAPCDGECGLLVTYALKYRHPSYAQKAVDAMRERRRLADVVRSLRA